MLWGSLWGWVGEDEMHLELLLKLTKIEIVPWRIYGGEAKNWK